MPCCVMCISGMAGCGEGLLSGIGESCSLVTADWNFSFIMFALYVVFVVSFPSLLMQLWVFFCFVGFIF